MVEQSLMENIHLLQGNSYARNLRNFPAKQCLPCIELSYSLLLLRFSAANWALTKKLGLNSRLLQRDLEWQSRNREEKSWEWRKSRHIFISKIFILFHSKKLWLSQIVSELQMLKETIKYILQCLCYLLLRPHLRWSLIVITLCSRHPY